MEDVKGKTSLLNKSIYFSAAQKKAKLQEEEYFSLAPYRKCPTFNNINQMVDTEEVNNISQDTLFERLFTCLTNDISVMLYGYGSHLSTVMGFLEQFAERAPKLGKDWTVINVSTFRYPSVKDTLIKIFETALAVAGNDEERFTKDRVVGRLKELGEFTGRINNYLVIINSADAAGYAEDLELLAELSTSSYFTFLITVNDVFFTFKNAAIVDKFNFAYFKYSTFIDLDHEVTAHPVSEAAGSKTNKTRVNEFLHSLSDRQIKAFIGVAKVFLNSKVKLVSEEHLNKELINMLLANDVDGLTGLLLEFYNHKFLVRRAAGKVEFTVSKALIEEYIT